MTRHELTRLRTELSRANLARYWGWANPDLHYPALKPWPPGYRQAFARWAGLGALIDRLIEVGDHEAIAPALGEWRRRLEVDGVTLRDLAEVSVDEEYFPRLARAVRHLDFLEGILWAVTPITEARQHLG